MSLFGRRATRSPSLADLGAPSRNPARRGGVSVTSKTALRHSGVWAALRLRRNLVSTMPVDLFRRVDAVAVSLPLPLFLQEPGGPDWDMVDWLSASQFDIDRCGNTVGLITEVNALGLPARVELQDIGACSMFKPANSDVWKWRIAGKVYERQQVWHERANPVAGLPLGLDPIAHAAWTLGTYQSIQEFALDWYGGGATPRHMLRNTQKTFDAKDAGTVKDRYNASVRNGDVFVSGNDWELTPMQAEAMGREWLDAQAASMTDVARYLDVPADVIDAAVSGDSVTYANVVQRNLQLLIMHLNPALVRREKALSRTQPKPRYVRLNRSALLQMDPETQMRVIHQQIIDRTLTVTEARQILDRPPLTPADEDEFARLFGAPRQAAPVKSVQSNTDELAYAGPVRATAEVGRRRLELEGTG